MARPLASPWPQQDVIIYQGQLLMETPDFTPVMWVHAYRNEDAAAADYLPERLPILWLYDGDFAKKTPHFRVLKNRKWKNGDQLDVLVESENNSRQLCVSAMKLALVQEKIFRAAIFVDPVADEAMTVSMLAHEATTLDATFDVVIMLVSYRYGVATAGEAAAAADNSLHVEVFNHTQEVWAADLQLTPTVNQP
jgi:hypothetical protein